MIGEDPDKNLKIFKAILDSDMDGVLCGAILCSIFGDLKLILTEPKVIQSGKFNNVVDKNTVIADLGFVEGCGLYFDHHIVNKPKPGQNIIGRWADYPSAAKIIFEYYKASYDLTKYKEIVDFVDLFDSGGISLRDMTDPKELIELALAITRIDKDFGVKTIQLLSKMKDLKSFFKEPLIINRIKDFRKYRQEYYGYLKTHTELIEKVVFVDNREFNKSNSHAYYVNVLFPDSDVTVMIKNNPKGNNGINLSISRNTFNKNLIEHDLLAIATKINPKISGGHSYACGVTLPEGMTVEEAKQIILQMLKKN